MLIQKPTMDYLHDFVGLPDYTYPKLGKKELDAVIDREYPDLEARGNVKTTKYAPLDKPSQVMLDTFFRKCVVFLCVLLFVLTILHLFACT